jgi:hypothetical protein
MNQNYINHIAILVDESWSMSQIKNDVIKVFENYVKHSARRSQETGQENRISVYQFNTDVTCTVFDKDVLRLPSIKNTYNPRGGTALIDATLKAISDLEKTNTLYGDHSFFLINLTDGENNHNDHKHRELNAKINSLPDNWTVAVFVPNQFGVAEAKKFGFPAGNIQVWNSTSGAGVDEMGTTLNNVTDNYMKGRASGVRGTRSLFQVNTANLTSDIVVNKLDQLKPNQYKLLDVTDKYDEYQIRDFVEDKGLTYHKGCSFYELTKTETVQANKQVAVQNKLSSKIYSGDEARQLLGLPNDSVRVAAGNFKNYKIFIQSTSFNRKLVAGTKLLYFV